MLIACGCGYEARAFVAGCPKRLAGTRRGVQEIATDLLLGGVRNGVGELVERIAHLRGGNIGGCVLESLNRELESAKLQRRLRCWPKGPGSVGGIVEKCTSAVV
jgi:hypothetical protein